ncbi:uncharacterized protein LOC112564623 [Pomacea canaliculata]|nr:uncharacterized protein LOC112564623 [Pomacea canaliculata]
MYTLPVCLVLAGLLVNVALTSDPYYKQEKCKGSLPASVVERSFKTCQTAVEQEYGEYYVETEPSTYAFDPDCPYSFLQKVPGSEYDGNVVYVYVYMPAAPGTVFDIEKCSLVAIDVKPQYPSKKPVY